ncbi:hypothetical protein [Shewanella waksmanii]|uniref:hypothetical protein n=1 Tax=Shewanella waksmanii TaxID=213783 RepID=UPI00373533FE
MNNPSLESVMAYKNQDVIDRFVKIFAVEEKEAELLFDDVKRWLWMANEVKHSGIKKPVVIDSALLVLDEMWHNFILFSREYAQFCQTYFGRFCHHAPHSKREVEREQQRTKDMTIAERKHDIMESKRWQYEFVYDRLGEDTFIRWYKVFPKKYDAETLARMAYEAEQVRQQKKREEIEHAKQVRQAAA